jgi:3-deoxy-D-manno-octulosonic-acid transferase
MIDELKMFAGRKHLGPLDRAVIKSVKAKIEVAKMIILQGHIEEIKSLEDLLKRTDLLATERKVHEMVLLAKEEELNDFLGIPNDGKNENDKLPEV